MNEITYPIWFISLQWIENGVKDHTGFRISFKRNYSKKSLENWATNWWKRYSHRKLKGKNVKLLNIDIEFLGKEVWVLTWFAHRSLNYFATQKEAFESFDRWFRQKGYKYSSYGYRADSINNEIGCPMGAEEDWRWKFCGCKTCKRLGITIIKH